MTSRIRDFSIQTGTATTDAVTGEVTVNITGFRGDRPCLVATPTGVGSSSTVTSADITSAGGGSWTAKISTSDISVDPPVPVGNITVYYQVFSLGLGVTPGSAGGDDFALEIQTSAPGETFQFPADATALIVTGKLGSTQ